MTAKLLPSTPLFWSVSDCPRRKPEGAVEMSVSTIRGVVSSVGRGPEMKVTPGRVSLASWLKMNAEPSWSVPVKMSPSPRTTVGSYIAAIDGTETTAYVSSANGDGAAIAGLKAIAQAPSTDTYHTAAEDIKLLPYVSSGDVDQTAAESVQPVRDVSPSDSEHRAVAHAEHFGVTTADVYLAAGGTQKSVGTSSADVDDAAGAGFKAKAQASTNEVYFTAGVGGGWYTPDPTVDVHLTARESVEAEAGGSADTDIELGGGGGGAIGVSRAAVGEGLVFRQVDDGVEQRRVGGPGAVDLSVGGRGEQEGGHRRAGGYRGKAIMHGVVFLGDGLVGLESFFNKTKKKNRARVITRI